MARKVSLIGICVDLNCSAYSWLLHAAPCTCESYLPCDHRFTMLFSDTLAPPGEVLSEFLSQLSGATVFSDFMFFFVHSCEQSNVICHLALGSDLSII